MMVSCCVQNAEGGLGGEPTRLHMLLSTAWHTFRLLSFSASIITIRVVKWPPLSMSCADSLCSRNEQSYSEGNKLALRRLHTIALNV